VKKHNFDFSLISIKNCFGLLSQSLRDMLKSKGLCLPKIPPSPQCFLGCSRRPVVKSQRASSTTIPLVVTNQNESDPNQTVIKSNKPALVVNFLVPYVTRPGQVRARDSEDDSWLSIFWDAEVSSKDRQRGCSINAPVTLHTLATPTTGSAGSWREPGAGRLASRACSST
jgi:hypothetical protein